MTNEQRYDNLDQAVTEKPLARSRKVSIEGKVVPISAHPDYSPKRQVSSPIGISPQGSE